jgi:hypothetical protein
MEEEINA